MRDFSTRTLADAAAFERDRARNSGELDQSHEADPPESDDEHTDEEATADYSLCAACGTLNPCCGFCGGDGEDHTGRGCCSTEAAWVDRLAAATRVSRDLLVPLGIRPLDVTLLKSTGPSMLIHGGESNWNRLIGAGVVERERKLTRTETDVIVKGTFRRVEFVCIWPAPVAVESAA